MPLQNRVVPTGEIVSDAARGTFTGNRGVLSFDVAGRLGASRWTHPHWIICTLTHPRGRYHGPQPKRAWTPLFFLDEAVGLAAGHRPCGYCRRSDYDRWKAAWAKVAGITKHTEMDRALHAARVTRDRCQKRHVAALEALPDGAFVEMGGSAWLLHGKERLRFSPSGYDAALARGTGSVTVLTPAPTLAVLSAGYRPNLHESAL